MASKTRTRTRTLAETLENLSQHNFEHFCFKLVIRRGLPRVRRSSVNGRSSLEVADVLVSTFTLAGAVQVAVEILRDIGCYEDAELLAARASAEVRHFNATAEKHESILLQKILATLEDLKNKHFEEFKWLLRQTEKKKGFPGIPKYRMEIASRVEVAELMVETYGLQSVEVTREVLEKMNRRDLVQRFSEISLGSEGSLELEGCGSTMQVSSDWTKLDPEVISTDEATTYSLQSEAGNFECSVSGLRWVCKEKVSLKYKFCSSKYHMEKIESIQYMPAGPLMDVTAIAGKLDVVYLPHWICIDDNPTILDKFAVLHIDDCGVTVEKVSEVTSSHVKLCEPTFSLKMVLVKLGFSVEINCKVFVYKTNRPFLKLHVYLIPPDPALKEELDETEKSFGYERIQLQHPKKPLKMNDWFILTAHLDGKEMDSDTLQLIYESMEPNFYELFIMNPDKDIELQLKREKELPVWTRKILKEAYQSTGPLQASGEHFVDKHRVTLIKRVSNLAAILDDLLDKKVIQQEVYAEICAKCTDEDKIRALYSGPLKAGETCKDIFYKILGKNEPFLIQELEE
ncbi:NACHT, LRR and PYD domains-containing protein 1 homolog [Centropristis striata]|uniref:NACHT, LRR and PYD domains-containing protein 1 homolog n=1 Tax=Centropristis striata TaxID=184440 RepID=UPI0027DEED02|nr:NACHT, LRR and PYD domains-containing protein 1 homolog [Centropristis striata]